MKKDKIAPPKIGARVLPINVAEEYIPSFAPLDLKYLSAIMAEAMGPRRAVAIP